MTLVRGNVVMEWPENEPRAKVTDASSPDNIIKRNYRASPLIALLTTGEIGGSNLLGWNPQRHQSAIRKRFVDGSVIEEIEAEEHLSKD